MEEKNKPCPANQHDESNLIVIEMHSKPEEDNFFIDKIPEIAFLIFSFLDLKNLCLASLVSKLWNQLANDELLWKLQFQKYTQGYLWRYLFQNPDASGCQKYFAEIFFVSNIDCNNFIKVMTPIKEKLLERINIVRSKKRKRFLENYFHHLNITKLNSALLRALEIIKSLPVGERENIINCDSQSFSKKCQKEKIGLLLKIHLIEIHLTGLIFLGKLAYLRADQSKEFLLLPINKFLSGSAITAIFAVEQHNLLEKDPTFFIEFLKRLNEKELVDCAQCSYLIAEIILTYPRVLNLLSDDSLIKVFYRMASYKLEEVFRQLMNHSPMLIKRLNADLLVRLVNHRKRQFISIPTIILSYSILINRLQEDQCVEIISNRGETLYLPDAKKMLQRQVFKDYTLKLKNPRAFLLQPNLVRAMFTIDWIVEILTPEDALLASKNDLQATQTIAMNNVLLNRFSQAQFLKLATRHESVVLVLLKNKDHHQRWKEKDFNFLRREYAYLSYRNDLENAIKEVKSKRVKKQVRFSIPQDIELRTTRRKIPRNQRYQSSYATTACQLGTHHLEKQQSQQIISTPKPLSIINNRSTVLTQRHQVKETTRQSNNSIFWSAAGLLGIGLLLATGILLCATAGGALAGVPFIVSAVTFLPVSIEIIGAVCLLAGTFLSLIGLNLANEHSTKFAKPIIASAKESLKKSLAEPVPSFFTPYKKYKPVFEPVAKLPLKPESNKVIYSVDNCEDNNRSSSRFSNR